MKRGWADVNGSFEFGDAAVEAFTLTAVVAVPSLLIPFAENPFEPHKAALLWVTTVAATAGLLTSAVPVTRLFQDRPWTKWLAMAAAFSAVSLMTSLALSPAPARAWWGSGLRRYGAFTELALLCMMVIVSVLGGNPARFGRIVAALVLGSVAPTVYGLAQWLGVDPLQPDGRLWSRPGGAFGNPLWLSGYLVAVMPLTVAYALGSREPLRKRAAGALVVLQVIAVLAARSRGPILAIGVAAAVVGAAILASRGSRRVARVVALAAAIAAAAALILVPRWVSHGTTAATNVMEIADRARATIAIRTLLWRAAASDIAGGPLRTAFGSGPESMPRVLTGYGGPSLRSLEAPEEIPDRAHNDALDRLVMLGAAGVAARFVTMYVALGAAFAAAGLLQHSHSTRFAALAAGVTVAAIAAGWLVDGAWTLAISTPAALVIVAFLWIAWRTRDGPPSHDVNLWAMAATAGFIAHFIDIQTSISSIASALVGTVMLALVVASADRSRHAAVAARARPGRGQERADDAPALLAGFASTLTLVALTTPAAGATSAVWALTIVTLLLGNILIGVQFRSLVVSAVVVMTFAFVWLPFPDTGTTPDIQGRALVSRVATLAVMFVAWFSILMWRLTQRPLRMRAILVQAFAVTLSAIVVGRMAVRTMATDVVMGAGGVCEARGDVACASAEYEEALRLDPTDPRGYTRMARALLSRADSSENAARRDGLFQRAAAYLARASSADPFDYHHPRNEGSLERRWARQLAASDRVRHLDQAGRDYAAAVARAPSVPSLWIEWANLHLEQGRIGEGLEKLEQSVALGRTGDSTIVGDALLAALGIDVRAAGGVEAAGAALRARGLSRLSTLYARRVLTGDATMR